MEVEKIVEKARGSDIRYAILSHRWGEGEVKYRDMQKQAAASAMEGYAKVQNFCKQAREHGFDHAWIDTCCIQKESSSELSEAINSMYEWYVSAAICFVYLSDVGSQEEIPKSDWFRRGWTLQELLAPRSIVFYNKSWEFLGTKESLNAVLATRTEIPRSVLRGRQDFRDYSIAQRMSWAAGRTTKEPEDRAYSLLGIFGIKMPMIHGEGPGAFIRLQEEIIKRTNDHTIFVWPIRAHEPGLLASSPDAFVGCSDVEKMTFRKDSMPYSMTNRGLSISLLARPFVTDTYLAYLDCMYIPQCSGPSEGRRMAMFIQRLDDDDQYMRVKYDNKTFTTLTSDGEAAWKLSSDVPVEHIRFNICQELPPEVARRARMDRLHGFRLTSSTDLFKRWKSGQRLYKVYADSWDDEKFIMSGKPRKYGFIGIIDIYALRTSVQMIKLGFDLEYNPVCFLATSNGTRDLHQDPSKEQLTEHELAQLKGVDSRTPFDDLAWNEIRGRKVEPFEKHPGLWALRGDRIHGLDVSLDPYAAVRITRAEIEGKMMWDVKISDLRNSIRKSLHILS